MRFLKASSRISKSKLASILTEFRTDVEVIEKIVKDDKSYSVETNEYDLLACSNKEFDYAYSFNGVVSEKFALTLSKSMIKTYMYIHFIPSGNFGIRKNVAYSDIAKSLGVSVVSVRNNIQRLVKLGLLFVTSNKRGLYDIIIVDEDKIHEAAQGGYITISYNMLSHLLSFDNVNELKLEIKKLLWCDAKVNSKDMNITCNKDNLLNVLPDYIRPGKREDLLYSNNSLFRFEGNSIDCTEYESKEDVIATYKKPYTEAIESFFDMVNMPYSKYHADNANNPLEARNMFRSKILILDDIANLAAQYSLDLVFKALNEMYENYGGYNKNETLNPPGFIRSKIRKYIEKDKVALC